jgi:hypothetical protein
MLHSFPLPRLFSARFNNAGLGQVSVPLPNLAFPSLPKPFSSFFNLYRGVRACHGKTFFYKCKRMQPSVLDLLLSMPVPPENYKKIIKSAVFLATVHHSSLQRTRTRYMNFYFRCIVGPLSFEIHIRDRNSHIVLVCL